MRAERMDRKRTSRSVPFALALLLAALGGSPAAMGAGVSPRHDRLDGSPRATAKRLYAELTGPAARYVARVARTLDPTRSLRIQVALLREDIVWQDRGLSARQIDIVVLVAVALSLDGVDKRLEALAEGASGDSSDRRAGLELYRDEALDLVERLVDELGTIRPSELKFYF